MLATGILRSWIMNMSSFETPRDPVTQQFPDDQDMMLQSHVKGREPPCEFGCIGDVKWLVGFRTLRKPPLLWSVAAAATRKDLHGYRKKAGETLFFGQPSVGISTWTSTKTACSAGAYRNRGEDLCPLATWRFAK